MTIVAEVYSYVIGVDTHSRTHTYAVLAAATRQMIASEQFPTTDAGLARALSWVARRTNGQADVLFAIEGTGSYGALLAAQASRAGYRVTEAPTPTRTRSTAKTDQIDAVAAATGTAVMDLNRLRDWRGADTGALLNLLVTARDSMTAERTRQVNALTALLRAHPLGIDARRPVTTTQIAQITAWHPRKGDHALPAAARTEAVRLARRIRQLDAELKENTTTMAAQVKATAPALLDEPGIGPVTAATILAVYGYKGRIRSADAFTAIAGTCPIPASSGNTSRHRLNRGGDRRLNRALHTITLTRMRSDPATLAYIAKRTAEKKTRKDIQRILKNRIARHLYRTLNANNTLNTPTQQNALDNT
jgi:transposase